MKNSVTTIRKSWWAQAVILFALIFFFAGLGISFGSNLKTQAAEKEETIKGYITTEWDWNANLKEDTAEMIDMKYMALTGLGITFQNSDGSWSFYLFDGNLPTNNTSGANGKWTFDGTGDQLSAYKLVQAQEAVDKMSSVPVTVKGYFGGETATGSKSGKTIQVLTVTAFNGVATSHASPVSSSASSAVSSATATSSAVNNPHTGINTSYSLVVVIAVLLLLFSSGVTLLFVFRKRTHS